MAESTGIEHESSFEGRTERGRRAWAGPKATATMTAKTRPAARRPSRTTSVRFGVLLLPAAGLPLTTWLGLAGLPHGAAAARRLLRDDRATAEIIPAQGWTLLSFVLMALGSGVGVLLAGL